MILSRNIIFRIVLFGIFSAAVFAADITGTVTNKTTNKPSAGDDVILLKLVQGMQEVTRAKTDAQGHFRLSPPSDSGDPAGKGIGFLIRVNHGKVNYHKPALPGTNSVQIDVYDAAETVESIDQSVDIMRLEADATNLRVVEMFAVTNSSKPPRTLLSPKGFEIALPEGAKIEESLAAGPGGMPINAAPTPTGQKNHYSFAFPIRPGESRFQVAYTMPYSGKATIQPVLMRPTENFAVTAPKSIDIAPSQGSKLAPKGEEAGLAVYVAQNARPGDPVGFSISGTGTAPSDNSRADTDAGGEVSRNKPGGGMGVPTNTPDPLYKYRWWLMGVVAIVLVAGAAFTMSRPSASESAALPRDSNALVVHALKEELFGLESERLNQSISADDYAKTKAALDLLMQRVINRK